MADDTLNALMRAAEEVKECFSHRKTKRNQFAVVLKKVQFDPALDGRDWHFVYRTLNRCEDKMRQSELLFSMAVTRLSKIRS